MASKKHAKRKAASRTRHAVRARESVLAPTAAEVSLPVTGATLGPEPTRPVRRPPVLVNTLGRVAATSQAVPYIALAALFGASVVIFGLLAAAHPLPDLFPDEMYYGKISQSIAAGHGMLWRHVDWGLPPLWPVVLSVVWHSGSAVDGFTHGKLLAVVVASTTVVPVWLLARTLVGPRIALIPAALSVSGAWMAVTAFITSDNLAYPLATASLAAAVVALQSTKVRWLAVSLGFAVVATLTRTQLLVLPVALLVALVLDVARQSPSARRTRFEEWPRALWMGLGAAVVIALGAFVANPHLTNYDLLAHHVSIGSLAKQTAKHTLTTIVLVAFVPAVAALALGLRRSNWRDPAVGPLLAVLAATTVVLMPVLGRFEAWAMPDPVDRYSMYLAPLFLITLVLAPGRVRKRDAAIALAVVSAALLLLPHYGNPGEQPALYGTQRRVELLGGVFKSHERVMLFALGTIITSALAWALFFSRKRAQGLAVGFIGVFLIMAVQLWTSQKDVIDTFHALRAKWSPADRDWVDRHASGRVAMLDIGKPEKIIGNRDLMTEFFSKKMDTVYAITYAGVGECQITLHAHGGLLRQKSGGCAPWPREFVVLNGVYTPALRGERVLASRGQFGRLVELPTGPPRVLSLIRPACGPVICDGTVKIGVYLDAPGKVTATFAAAKDAHLVDTGKRLRILPPGRENTISVSFAKGDQAAALAFQGDPKAQPKLLSVTLTTQGHTRRVY